MRVLRPLAAAVAAAAVATAGIVVAAGSASAAQIGTLSVSPATGSDQAAISVTTSGGCPSNGTHVQVKIFGNGFPSGGQNGTPVTNAGVSQSGPFAVNLSDTMKTFAQQQSPPATLNGKYDLVLVCRAQLNATSLGDYVGSIWFTSSTAYQDTDPNATIPTTTTLSVSPPSPVNEGTAVTLTATISPSGATGTVQFRNGAANLGSPVTVTGGTASLTTSALPVGTHSLAAMYVSTGQYDSSGTEFTPYTVNAVPAGDTTTSLAVAPASGSANQYSSVTLTATVTPSSAAGTVQFKDGATNLGAPVAVSGGTATLTRSYAVGAHSFTASFLPSNAAAHNPSTSGNVPYEVTSFSGVTDSETIQTTVADGALTLTISDAPVVLPTPVLNASNDLLSTSGSLNPVTVTDLRAGDPGWNVSGQVGDFAAGAETINGSNLGWTPSVVDEAFEQDVVAGAVVQPANGIAPGATAPDGAGLTSSRTLASAADDQGRGTSHVTALLSLNVPTSTAAGTYTAVLTLTAI